MYCLHCCLVLEKQQRVSLNDTVYNGSKNNVDWRMQGGMRKLKNGQGIWKVENPGWGVATLFYTYVKCLPFNASMWVVRINYMALYFFIVCILSLIKYPLSAITACVASLALGGWIVEVRLWFINGVITSSMRLREHTVC